MFFFLFIIISVILLYYYIAVTDALNWIAIFKKEIYSLRNRENLLKSQLTIFGINYPDSRELRVLSRAYSTSQRFSTCEGCSSDRIGVAIDGRMERRLGTLQNRKFLDDRIGRDGHNR